MPSSRARRLRSSFRPWRGGFVQRGERLIHQQQSRLAPPGRGRWRPASSCRRTIRGDRRGEIRQSQPRQGAVGAGIRFGAGHASSNPAAAAHWSGIGPGHQGGFLEDKAHFRPRGVPGIAPLSGAIRPAIRRSAVDLPQPLGPSSETNSPSATSKAQVRTMLRCHCRSACRHCSASASSSEILQRAAHEAQIIGLGVVQALGIKALALHGLIEIPPALVGHAAHAEGRRIAARDQTDSASSCRSTGR